MRKPRAIRFSDSEWEEVKKAAERYRVPAAEYVRTTILHIARDPSGPGSGTIPADLVPLIERTFRYAYMLATKLRDDMSTTDTGKAGRIGARGPGTAEIFAKRCIGIGI